MTIHLPAELERFVQDQVFAGHYPSQDAVVRAALEQLRTLAPVTAARLWLHRGHARRRRPTRPNHPGHHGKPPHPVAQAHTG